MTPDVEKGLNLINEIVPNILEGYVMAVAAAEPRDLMRLHRNREYVRVVIPVPRSLVQHVDLNTLTRERFQKALPAPFSWLLKYVTTQKEGTIDDKDGQVLFDLALANMIALYFDFVLPYGILDGGEDDDAGEVSEVRQAAQREQVLNA